MSRLHEVCGRVSEIITSWGLAAPSLGDQNLEATEKILAALEWADKKLTDADLMGIPS